jgi:hypothetical protein
VVVVVDRYPRDRLAHVLGDESGDRRLPGAGPSRDADDERRDAHRITGRARAELNVLVSPVPTESVPVDEVCERSPDIHWRPSDDEHVADVFHVFYFEPNRYCRIVVESVRKIW